MTDAAAGSAVYAATERAHTVDALTESLNSRINRGEFDVGSWIRQARIAEEYGVSRTPVALALSRLEAVGVVERVANRGFRVRVPSTRDIIEVIEVRALLEGHAAELAATRISGDRMARLFEAVEGFRAVAAGARAVAAGSPATPGAAGDDELRQQWHRANSLFHDTVFDAAGNRLLVETAEMLHHRLPRNTTWTAMGGDPRLLTQNAHDHERIALAIDVRDFAQARELTIAHLFSARDLILARFDAART